MRLLTIILILWVLSAGRVLGQGADQKISDIRENYHLIQNTLEAYDTTMMYIWDESAEGGHGVACYEEDSIKLIEVVWFGEMGKSQIEYYFKEGQLFFAFSSDFVYNRPFYMDEERVKEMEDKEIFEEEKTVVKENRFYFHEGKLIRWLDEEQKEKDAESPGFSEKEKALNSHAREMKAKFSK